MCPSLFPVLEEMQRRSVLLYLGEMFGEYLLRPFVMSVSSSISLFSFRLDDLSVAGNGVLLSPTIYERQSIVIYVVIMFLLQTWVPCVWALDG